MLKLSTFLACLIRIVHLLLCFRKNIACNYLSCLILHNVWNRVNSYFEQCSLNANTESISVSSQNMLSGALLPFHYRSSLW